ncbi:MAG: polyprenyl synthetase family protein [Sphaerobacter sp.]|nr:polyprenyl synthetase family protein [Sphaerobacter sp.]
MGWQPLDLSDVMSVMRADVARVEDRLREEVRVEFPFVGEILQGLIDAGGKRLRPLTLLLAARPFSYDIERLLPAAVGVELLHTASLIHDDTVDRALLRRGRPTLNSIFSTETVILLGDYVFARSAMMAAQTMNPRVMQVFASSLAHICDGQLREIFTARELDQSFDDYRRRIFGKTASLFAGSAEMGAILGEADEPQIQALRRYGENLGMAFQIVDDVLDLRESTDEIGKPAGLDLRQGTITLPTMLFFELNRGNGHYAELVRRVVDGRGATDEDYATATAVIRESGALERALEIAAEYVRQAREALRIVPPGEGRDLLEVLAEASLSRTR